MPADHHAELNQAAGVVQAGAWAVGVSGGADSVALLRLLMTRADLRLTVVHMNHQLRGDESETDERFVIELATSLGLPCEVIRADQIVTPAARNPSTRYRLMRLAALAAVIKKHSLAGAIYAHHADDQAETVLLRLLRGSGYAALAGMRDVATVRGVLIHRPLLAIRRSTLRDYLAALAQPWREDSSNASSTYRRNVVRGWLAKHDATEELLTLSRACRVLAMITSQQTSRDDIEIDVIALSKVPLLIAEATATVWLRRVGVPLPQIAPATVAGIVNMAADASTPSKLTLPGGSIAQRRNGKITAISYRPPRK